MSDTSESIMPCPQCNVYLDPGIYLVMDVAEARSHCNLCHGSGKIPGDAYLEYNRLNLAYFAIYAVICAFIYFL